MSNEISVMHVSLYNIPLSYSGKEKLHKGIKLYKPINYHIMPLNILYFNKATWK